MNFDLLKEIAKKNFKNLFLVTIALIGWRMLFNLLGWDPEYKKFAVNGYSFLILFLLCILFIAIEYIYYEYKSNP